MNKKIVIYTLFAVFFSLLIAFYFNFGRIVPRFFTTEKIENILSEETNLDFKINSLSIDTTLDLCAHIKFKDFLISIGETNKQIVHLTNADLKIEILPLIFHKIYLKRASFGGIMLNILRDKAGVFEFEKYLKNKEKNDFKVALKGADINVGTYFLSFNDEKYNISNVLEGQNFIGNDLDLKKNLDFETHGKLTTNGADSIYDVKLKIGLPFKKHFGDSDFEMNAAIVNFDFKALKPYFENTKEITGLINLDVETIKGKNANKVKTTLSLDNFVFHQTNSFVKTKDKILFNGDFEFDGKDIKVSNVALNSKNIKTTASGELLDLFTKHAKIDLNVACADTQMNDLIYLVPDTIKTPEDSIRKLKKYNWNGIANGKIQIKGDILRPLWFGRVDVKDLFVIAPVKNVKPAIGFMEFKEDKIYTDLKVFAPHDEYVTVKGFSELYDKQRGKYEIKSSNNVDLNFTMRTLLPVRDTIGFLLGPLPYMQIKGTGGVDIVEYGTKDDALIDGEFHFNNASTTIAGFADWLTDAQGKLKFKKDEILFENWHAKLNGAPVKIEGLANLKGTINLRFLISNLDFSHALSVANKSEILKNYVSGLEAIKNPSGKIDVDFTISGLVKEFDLASLTKAISAKGEIILHSCAMNLPFNVSLKNTDGKIKFNEKYDIDLTSHAGNSQVLIKGTILPKNEKMHSVNMQLSSARFTSSDIYKLLAKNNLSKMEKLNFDVMFDVSAKGDIPTDFSAFDLNKINLEGVIKGVNSDNSLIKFQGGLIKLSGKKADFQNLILSYQNSRISINGFVDNIFMAKNNPDLNINIRNLNFSSIANLINSFEIPLFKKLLGDFSDFKGGLSGNIQIKNDKFKGKIVPSNLSVFSKSKNVYFTLKSGDILFNNKDLKLNAFNLMLDETPFYIDCKISNFASQNPLINTVFSTNINEAGVDKFINSNLNYPIKLTGETLVSGKLSGYKNKYNLTSSIILNPASDISYMGANLGDIDVKREIGANISFFENTAKIHKIEYAKFVSSQNNRNYALPVIRASGNIVMNKNDVSFAPLNVRTLNSVTAKLFNVYFKKSILKQGLFNCDLKLQGNMKEPKISGKMDFKNINIPLYDTKIQDIDLVIDENYINGEMNGSSADSDVNIKIKAKNSTKLPILFENVTLFSNVINLERIYNNFANTQAQSSYQNATSYTFKPKDFIVKNGDLNVGEVKMGKISATNLKAKFHHNENGILKVDDMIFDIAEGKVKSNGAFNPDNVSIKLSSKIENCNANTLATGFFNLPGQLYGTMRGDIEFFGSKLNTKDGINTIKSDVKFEIVNGKMPKLGSLEYLLRAGNIYKSGILGLSLNNLINLIVPYNTGEFRLIDGRFIVKNGFIDNLEIFTTGENLSLFLNGKYNILAQNADIFVFGRLSKKVSNKLGVVGNASINSLISVITNPKNATKKESEIIQNINKIPLIEINDNEFRLFRAKIKGNLNKDNYVESFNWLN